MKILLNLDALVECPYCEQEIVGGEREDAHGECEHLILIHVPLHDEDKPGFVQGDPILEWWNAQDFPSLWQHRVDDRAGVETVGIENVNPNLARVLEAYSRCPHIDVLILQEDQGSGPSSGAIGPVLFGFSKGRHALPLCSGN